MASCSSCIQIHLMLLLIQGCRNRGGFKFNSNTSHVTINPTIGPPRNAARLHSNTSHVTINPTYFCPFSTLVYLKIPYFSTFFSYFTKCISFFSTFRSNTRNPSYFQAFSIIFFHNAWENSEDQAFSILHISIS